jgi:hypothetical protein
MATARNTCRCFGGPVGISSRACSLVPPLAIRPHALDPAMMIHTGSRAGEVVINHVPCGSQPRQANGIFPVDTR